MISGTLKNSTHIFYIGIGDDDGIPKRSRIVLYYHFEYNQ